jgi:hypothetical protein
LGVEAPVESADSGRLHVRRLVAHYVVSRDHPDPSRLKSRLDELSRDAIDLLPTALARDLSGDGRGVCLIRRLAIDIAIDVGAADATAAMDWARATARSVSDRVDAADDGEGVVRFPDAAGFLAQFLIDLANQTAWSKWYYFPFRGLRLIPVGSAIRTAVLDRPDLGLDALRGLSTSERAGVVTALSEADARAVLDGLSQGPSGHALAQYLGAAWSASRDVLVSPDGTAEARAALDVFIATSKPNRSLAGPELRLAVFALRSLTRAVAGFATILPILASQDLTALIATVGEKEAQRLEPLFHCDPDLVHTIAESLRADDATVAASPVPEAEHRFTPTGGAFLLLPRIDEIIRALRGQDAASDAANGQLKRVLAFGLLLRCLGGARARSVWRDGSLRDLLGLPLTLSIADFRRHLRVAAMALPSTGVLSDRTLPESGDIRILASVRRRRGGTPAVVLVDADSGLWCGLWPTGDPKMVAALRHERGVLLADDDLLPSLRVGSIGRACEAISGHVGARAIRSSPRVAETVTRLESLPADLDYLRMPRELRTTPTAERRLAVAAQRILRRFAQSLPGFELSGLSYLDRNFLAFDARVEATPERWVVQLSPPPLNLVLSMSGQTRATHRVSWLADREIVLYQ